MMLGGARNRDPLAHSLDDAVAEANRIAAQRLADDPAQLARLDADASRWSAIRAAQREAGPHAVVIPIAVARDAIAYLREHSDEEPPLSPDMIAELIEAAFPDRLTT